MGKRLFTEEEIKEMETETKDLILQAIDAGDFEKAKKLTQRMHREYFSMHELLRDGIISLLSFIGKRLGDQGVYEALHEQFESFVELQKRYEKEDVRRQVQMLAAGLRGHLTRLIIKEDDEKISIAMNPCGSGGRAITSGSYSPPKNFLTIKGPQKMTFGRGELPVYCCHCAFTEIVPMEVSGYPIWVREIAEDLGVKPCWSVIYKDKKKIPTKYWKRYGLKKPIT